MEKEELRKRLERAIQSVPEFEDDSSPVQLQALQDLVVSQGSGSRCSKCRATIFPSRARICFVCGCQIQGQQRQNPPGQTFDFEASIACGRFLQSLSLESRVMVNSSVTQDSSFSTQSELVSHGNKESRNGEEKVLDSSATRVPSVEKAISIPQSASSAKDPVSHLLSRMSDLSFMLADHLVVPVGGPAQRS